MALSQDQSPFFRLPRELRDSIYTYYVTQEHGYRYEKGRLVGNNGPIDFSLPHSCRAIFEEMKGIHLRANEIIFTPIRPEADGLSHSHDPRDKIHRFETLQHAIFESKLTILSCAASCVDEAVRSKVKEKYPDDFLSDIAFAIGKGKLDRYFFWKDNRHQRERGVQYGLFWEDFPETFYPSLHYLLDLIRPDARFCTLASKAGKMLYTYYHLDDAVTPLMVGGLTYVPTSDRNLLTRAW
ncbi:hypothetical protein FKW77_005025 [Venturia effusa]|uniref:Uncharacterized protein n=1 Tax=Venturia effusa TaxID=50376 RepID=A0A517LDP7_9PEZI|nr:hypothetical protein FKW77_005025 [Venturia effusa]